MQFKPSKSLQSHILFLIVLRALYYSNKPKNDILIILSDIQRMNKQQSSTLTFIQTFKNRSTTQEFSPVYRRKNRQKPNISLYLTQVKSKQETTNFTQAIRKIQELHSKINSTIHNFDAFVKHRMLVHEKQLLQIMRSQVSLMLQDLKLTISNFNGMIVQKNMSQQIHQLQQQIDCYKINILRILNENKQLQRQNKKLKEIITTHEDEKTQNREVLKKITKQLMKEKIKVQQFQSEKKVKIGSSSSKKDITKQQSYSHLSSLIPRQRSVTDEQTPERHKLSTIPSQLLIESTKNTVKRVLKPIGRFKFVDKNEIQTYRASLNRLLNPQLSLQ